MLTGAAQWSRAMIFALGVRVLGSKSQLSPLGIFHKKLKQGKGKEEIIGGLKFNN